MFLSAALYTPFLFFELMSLSSYAWVVQEESPDALDAGKTYLTIAVLGGLVTLMGLFLLYRLTATLVIADLPGLCAGKSMWCCWSPESWQGPPPSTPLWRAIRRSWAG